MKIKRAIQACLTAGALSVAAFTASAHNGIEHVLGTVKVVDAKSITVDTTAHKTNTVWLDATTTFSYKGAPGTLKELKPGDRVAIDGKDGADKKLHAISVKWGAAATAGAPRGSAPAKPAHQMDPSMKM